ncbi:succinate dehydrogenase, cytochrome b556 subunit [Lichenicoccus sp.]|uniref:succinate dehydrogenase, cytochrome b556 subunit n=1 Tax=Lichenicoccus sp. TaxID=2781899 RepID=UPI003D11B6B2
MKDVRDALFVAQRSDGTLTRRPMSPHLQVYRPQLTSVLSIANRMSGIAISFGTLLLVWWLVAAASGPKPFAVVQAVIANPFGLIVLFGWTLALMYHFFGGLRHLAWDAGRGFSLAATYRSGWAAVIGTVVMTVLVWAIGLSLWG